MNVFNNIPATLLLQDGTVFKGISIGKIGTTTGEVCFNTGMTGYQEIFTDPSYFGQIMVSTVSHIGNYGTSDREIESEGVKISGLVCKHFSDYNSRHLSNEKLQDYFLRHNITGIANVDTRALVRHIREKGAMNAIISSEIQDIEVLKAQLAKVPDMHGLELSSKVATKTAYTFGDPEARFKVAVLDLGVKKNILRCLADRGCFLKIFPAQTSAAEMATFNPDGYFISNGPGDPAAMPYAIETMKGVLETGKPMFGICLGHQMLALSQGIPTYKMHNGHRGINHPVKNIIKNRCEITSQNHGFAVDPDAVKNHPNVEVTHINLNDNTIEGIRLKDRQAFSVQYHPESSPGPHDSRYLFDDFVAMLG